MGRNQLERQAAGIIERAERAGCVIGYSEGERPGFSCFWGDATPPDEYLEAMGREAPLKYAMRALIKKTRRFPIAGAAS